MTCPDIFMRGRKADRWPWVAKATSMAKIWRNANKRVSDKCKPYSPRRGDSKKRMRYCVSRYLHQALLVATINYNAHKTRASDTWHGRKTTCGDDPRGLSRSFGCTGHDRLASFSTNTTTSKGSTNRGSLGFIEPLHNQLQAPKRVHGIEVLHIR
ncbi:hypothetical protein AAG906_022313 [Vitis piasezkii]